jgi:hypothetical protein
MNLQINTPIVNALWQLQRGTDYLDLAREIMVEVGGAARSAKLEMQQGADGGVVSGDRRYEGRQVRFTFKPSAEPGEPDDWRSPLNALEGFFYRRETVYLIDKQAGLRIEVVPSRSQVRAEQPELRRVVGNGTMDLLCPDPLWETLEIINYGGTGASDDSENIELNSGDALTVNNDSEFDAFPIITLTPQNVIESFRLLNTTLNGGFEYTDPSFAGAPGAENQSLVMDGTRSQGHFRFGNVDTSANLSAGGLIWLRPGQNTLQYESDAGSVLIRVQFRRRFLH